MIVEITDKYFSVEECNKNPDKVYIFGDNLLNYGKAGQAIIRDCDNSLGIPTKRKPSNEKDAFFSDTKEDKEIFKDKLEHLVYLLTMSDYKTIIFPKNGLGTGLAQMPTKSPKLFKTLCTFMNENFGLKMNEKGIK